MFYDWLKKYIPPRSQNKVMKKAGLGLNNIQRWKNGSSPNLHSIIYLSKSLSLLYGYDYKTIVIEGIKAASQN
jgi:hypothetical protein